MDLKGQFSLFFCCCCLRGNDDTQDLLYMSILKRLKHLGENLDLIQAHYVSWAFIEIIMSV